MLGQLQTKNAYRTLPLAKDTASILKEQKKEGEQPGGLPVIRQGAISPDSVLHMLHQVLKRAGMPKMRFYDLRHTFAALALPNGVDIKTVSGMLEHFSAGFILDTYAHVTASVQKAAATPWGNSSPAVPDSLQNVPDISAAFSRMGQDLGQAETALQKNTCTHRK